MRRGEIPKFPRVLYLSTIMSLPVIEIKDFKSSIEKQSIIGSNDSAWLRKFCLCLPWKINTRQNLQLRVNHFNSIGTLFNMQDSYMYKYIWFTCLCVCEYPDIYYNIPMSSFILGRQNNNAHRLGSFRNTLVEKCYMNHKCEGVRLGNYFVSITSAWCGGDEISWEKQELENKMLPGKE